MRTLVSAVTNRKDNKKIRLLKRELIHLLCIGCVCVRSFSPRVRMDSNADSIIGWREETGRKIERRVEILHRVANV